MRFFHSILRKTHASDKALGDALKNILGYYPGNLALYKLALRHRSAATPLTNGFKHSNERLEYLGDAVLGSIIADFLFKKFPYKDEGFLTEMRSRIVSRSNLNALSKKLGLNRLIETSIDGKIAGSSIPGDAFEALVGAIYLDKGYRFTQKILIHQIIACHLDMEELVSKEINFKSKIIEWSQKERKTADFVLVEEIENGKKNRLYLVNLLVDGQVAGSGQDYSIKKAEQKAAAEAWEKLVNNGDQGE
ncbi:MAG: ribonuclease III [Bacteroides sp.]|nr:ribonuclease III [Bacteroides sp.]